MVPPPPLALALSVTGLPYAAYLPVLSLLKTVITVVSTPLALGLTVGGGLPEKPAVFGSEFCRPSLTTRRNPTAPVGALKRTTADVVSGMSATVVPEVCVQA